MLRLPLYIRIWCILGNALQGIVDHIIPSVSSSLEMIEKVVLEQLLVTRLGYPGVLLSEPLVSLSKKVPLYTSVLKLKKISVFKVKIIMISVIL